MAAIAALVVGAAAQCAVVVDLTPGTTANNNTAYLTAAFGQELYFAQTTASQGTELWKWSAAAGVTVVRDLVPGAGSSNPEQLFPWCTSSGPRLFFSASAPGRGFELHASDGTDAGTAMVKEIRAGSASSLPQKFVGCGERVLFQANDGILGDELWVSDGTTAGTVMVRDLAPGAANGRPSDMVAHGGRVLFGASDGALGRELWSSDGTTAGTTLVLDVWPGASSAEVGELASVGDFVYFRATTATHGTELWRTDGTPAGTQLVVDLFPGVSSADPIELRACGGRLFFRAGASPSMNGLWVLDAGASTPTFLGGGAAEITCAGARVFFRRGDFAAGEEPWVSDGTPAGTQRIADLRPGPLGSGPFRLVAGGSGVFFVATTTNAGELWFSDGTAAGTTRQCTLDPVTGYAPYGLTMCRGMLFFVGYDPAVGYELFAIDTPGASATLLGAGGRPDHTSLATRDGTVPVLGGPIELVGRGPAGQLGVLLFGPSQLPLAVPVVPGLIDGGCDWTGLFLGQATIQELAVVPDPSFVLAVPAIPALEGQPFHFQMAWLSAAGSFPLQLSNGLQLVPGPLAPH